MFKFFEPAIPNRGAVTPIIICWIILIRLLNPLADLPRVADILLRVQFSGLANNGQADLPIIGEGIQPDKEARLGTALTITDGRQLTAADTNGILIGQGVSKALQLKPGNFVTLLVTTTDGALNSLEFEVIGIFRTFARDYDNRAVRIPFDVAQELIGTTGAHSLVLSWIKPAILTWSLERSGTSCLCRNMK